MKPGAIGTLVRLTAALASMPPLTVMCFAASLGLVRNEVPPWIGRFADWVAEMNDGEQT